MLSRSHRRRRIGGPASQATRASTPWSRRLRVINMSPSNIAQGYGRLTPRALPFALAPGVLEAYEALAVNFDGPLHRVRVQLHDALALTPSRGAPDAGAAAKEELLVDFQELAPKVLLPPC